MIQVPAYNDYMISNPRNADRQAAIGAARGTAPRTLSGREATQQQLAAIDQKYPYRRATFEDYMQHLLHVIRVAGVEHAGIGIDFDGGGGVQGFEDASDYPKITARLLAKVTRGRTCRRSGVATYCAYCVRRRPGPSPRRRPSHWRGSVPRERVAWRNRSTAGCAAGRLARAPISNTRCVLGNWGPILTSLPSATPCVAK